MAATTRATELYLSRLGSWLVPCLGLVACNELEPTPVPVFDEPAGAAGQGGASGAPVRTASLFPDHGEQCASCLDDECSGPLASCHGYDQCNDLIRCRLDAPNPATREACNADYSDARLQQAYDDLHECWVTRCQVDCAAGNDWDCVDDVNFPRPPTDTVRLTQRLLSLIGQPLANLQVAACTLDQFDCDDESPALARTTTDETGTYSVSVPTGSTGWLGIERIVGSEVPPQRLQLNIPISSHWLRQTRLLNTEVEGMLRGDSGASPELNHVFFQVFDCAEVGADGVTIQVEPETAEMRLLYTRQTDLVPDARGTETSAAKEGAGAILNLPPETDIEITAMHEDRRVATMQLHVPSLSELTHIRMFPNR